MNLTLDALAMVEKWSKTFYAPIILLPKGLQEAVTSTYLCLRAIDEIEDHPELDNLTKVELLRNVSLIFQTVVNGSLSNDFPALFDEYYNLLPEVTLRIYDWALLAPKTIAPRIWDGTAAMADRVAHWASINWQIHTESDLERYSFAVSGAAGLLLSELWSWYDGTQTNRTNAIGFGCFLQSVNILRGRADDLARGIDFFPDGWSENDMQIYACRNLVLAKAYIKDISSGPIFDACSTLITVSCNAIDDLARGKAIERDGIGKA